MLQIYAFALVEQFQLLNNNNNNNKNNNNNNKNNNNNNNQFSDCPLIQMFHSRTLNNKINRSQRSLSMVYGGMENCVSLNLMNYSIGEGWFFQYPSQKNSNIDY